MAVSGTKFKFKIFHEKLETHIMNAEQRFLLVLQDKTCKKYKICHLCGFFTACNLQGGKSSVRPLYKPQTPPLKLFIFSLVGSLVCNRLWNKSGAIKLNVMTASVIKYVLTYCGCNILMALVCKICFYCTFVHFMEALARSFKIPKCEKGTPF